MAIIGALSMGLGAFESSGARVQLRTMDRVSMRGLFENTGGVGDSGKVAAVEPEGSHSEGLP